MRILHINNIEYPVNEDPETPLLWVLRDSLGLTGTKYSCGIGACGNCIVLIDGEAVPSCTLPLSSVGENASITTIEGLSQANGQLSRLQEIWQEEMVSECGFCQPGQILMASALVEKNPNPTEEQVADAMSRVLCRCGTYLRIRKAILRYIRER